MLPLYFLPPYSVSKFDFCNREPLLKHGMSLAEAPSAGHEHFGLLSADLNGAHCPRFMPYHITIGLVQKMYRLILTACLAPVFKACSNSGFPIARITLPTTDVSQPYQMFFFFRCLSQNLAHVEFVMSWRWSKKQMRGLFSGKTPSFSNKTSSEISRKH